MPKKIKHPIHIAYTPGKPACKTRIKPENLRTVPSMHVAIEAGIADQICKNCAAYAAYYSIGF